MGRTALIVHSNLPIIQFLCSYLSYYEPIRLFKEIFFSTVGKLLPVAVKHSSGNSLTLSRGPPFSVYWSLLRELIFFPWVKGYNPPRVITEASGAFSASRIDTE